MANVLRRAWDLGWVPDADPTNGPVTALLRMDNAVLDDLGAVVLRAGSAKVNSSPLADADVHSLYTTAISGTRMRMVGAGAAVYANGTGISAGTAGSGDIAFGTMCGQVFWARSTTTKKYDGTTVRNWGISMTGTAPTLAALASDSIVLMSCDIADTALVAANEGSIAYSTGQDGSANGSIAMTASATTGRSAVTKTFAADTDLTAYTSGQVGVPNDLLEFYLWVEEPTAFMKLTVMVDCNSSSTNPFQDDYFTFTITRGDRIDLSDISLLEDDYVAEGRTRDRVRAREDREGKADSEMVTELRQDLPVLNAGWSKVAIRRGMFTRVGGTAGKGWDTVKAIRVVLHLAGGGVGSPVVKIDAMRLIGGAERPLTGKYKYRYVYVRNDGVYLAKSAPSALSTELELKANGTTVTLPADASRDSQVNEIWVYRYGGDLDAWYRVAVKTGVSGAGSYSVADILSDTSALILNLRLETDNALPPSDIVDIEGPYYDRLWALTATTLWPSRRLDPDAFATGQAITVGDSTETAYWVKKAMGGLFVGTSKDVYSIMGTAAEEPDESIDIVKRPLNVDHPPISAAVTQDGDRLFYLSSDGWRLLSEASAVLPNHPRAIYRGETRHGVSAANLTTGRFRAAVAKGILSAITPEGASTTSSAVLHRARLGSGHWYRHTYPVSFRSIYQEPDGTLIAGDTAGTVWVLDTGTSDGGTAIAPVLWTLRDDAGAPFVRKDPRDARLLVDTGNTAMTADLHLDGSETAALSTTVTENGVGATLIDLSTCAAFTRAQWRLSGSLPAFRLCAVEMNSLDLPHTITGRTAETSAGYPGEKVITGLTIRVCTLGETRTVTPYFDGVAGTPFTITSETDEPDTHLEAFVSTVTAVDLSLSFDGEVELYDWAPVVLYRIPLRVSVWDSGPLDLGVPDLTWLRSIRVKVIGGGADLTVRPYFDGLPWPALTIVPDTERATVKEVAVPRGCKGRTPRLVISSTAPFALYWVELLRRMTTAQTDKKPIRFPAGVGGSTKA